ncbi:GNAT family N-acetyltransferase [Embleya sp. NPDC008237]|uniref:GNAT family N-acetyltransferase n=1 Tax=Embleya sp. NPDC008237 TaxID=3363978 RepID=UPI0036E35A37
MTSTPSPTAGQSPDPGPSAVTVRDATRPGDLGALAALHGVLYSREYGMDTTMEAGVAAGMAELVLARAREGHDGPGRMWVAEDAERVLGGIGITREEDGWMRLRWVILDPAARGRGVGGALLDTALAEARRRDAVGVYLWTIAGLDASRHLYDRAGFTLTEEHPARAWGIDAVEQRFDLKW